MRITSTAFAYRATAAAIASPTDTISPACAVTATSWLLAASDALVHSSAGLTVLEAIIRGCPVISYGFGYGHVRASNAALERFGLAQVARDANQLSPALQRALEHRPEPDSSFARRPSTAPGPACVPALIA